VVDLAAAPLCSVSLVAEVSRAAESNANFIPSVIPRGTSTAKGAATSNVRLFIARFYQSARERFILNWF
jgi:hypothetical protein